MVAAHTLILALALSSVDEPVLIEFSAAWCGPCQSMEPVIQRLASGGYPVRKVDVDQDPNTAAKYRVTGLPTFVMLKGGRETDRVVGAASFARLQQMYGKAPADRRRRAAALRQQPQQASANELTPASQPAHRSPARGMKTRPASNSPNRSIIDHALAATVRIKVEDRSGHGFGTGTVIDTHGSEALVVTCGHIFRESAGKGPISVETFDGSPAKPGQLVSYDLKRDIGLVSFVPARPIKPAVVAAVGDRIQPGNAVFSIGCDRGANPSVRESQINDVDRYEGPPNIEVAGQPVEGRSGGGLFGVDGGLIGICNFADPADDEGIYASLATIHWELDRIGQRRIYQQQPLDAPETLLAAAAEPARMPTNDSPMPPVMPAEIEITPVGSTDQAAEFPADLEVICIVRSRSNPNGESRVVVLDRPSPALLSQLNIRSPARRIRPGPDRTRLPGGRRRVGPIVRAQSSDR